MDPGRISYYTQPVVFLALTACFIYLAITGQVSADVFVLSYGVVLAFFFKSQEVSKELKKQGGSSYGT